MFSAKNRERENAIKRKNVCRKKICALSERKKWLQAATWANPVRHMMVILRGVFLKDMPAEVAWESLWPMALIGFLCLAGASWFFRRRLG